MNFNSLQYLAFLPLVVLVYYIFPKKIRYIWLLASSYYFYMSWNAKYALLILTVTLATYAGGLVIQKCPKERKTARKLSLVCVLLCCLGLLAWFKYFAFLANTFGGIMSLFGLRSTFQIPDILLPVGISFYTFQALGYVIDVYRGDTEAEKNPLRYSLFVVFFPQLVAGPIERSGKLLKRLRKTVKYDFNRLKEGLLLILWGLFLKLVLAGRLALFVDTVYGDIKTYDGWYLICATIFFGLQIYCDFYAYSVIAVGSAKMLGIGLMENFSAPYLSLSVAEFWRYWHISLTSWFRDYVYIPLGGNRKGRVRKWLITLFVFFISGLWHGASWSFVLWGGINGLYIVVGEITKVPREKICDFLKIDVSSLAHRIIKGLITFALVDFAWIFFRAKDLSEALKIIRSIFTAKNIWIFFDDTILECGLSWKSFVVLGMGLLILLVADILKIKGYVVSKKILEQHDFVQIVLISATVVFLVIFGIYGKELDAGSFIYFQF